MSTQSFADFGVHQDIVDSLADAGIHSPFPIQAMTLPVALGGHDIIGQAKTGTGKTLGFGVPMLDRIVSPNDPEFASISYAGRPQALAVAPTRELAIQVAGDLEKAGRRRGIRVLTVYGGRAYEPQIEALKRGVEVVVGTPGRLIDLAKQGHLNLSSVKTLVLDEADEMLDLGFLPDIEKILRALEHEHQTMLFSATMPGPIITLARSFLSQPVHIRAEEAGAAQTHSTTEQVVFMAHRMDKAAVTARILQANGRGRTIIFARTKRTAAEVAEELAGRGFTVGAVHGDMGQPAREKSLNAFRDGTIEILVATDVAARGIDIDDVTHVINYQTPDDPMTYVHRIGRTGRAGHSGTAITLVGYDELPKWKAINEELDLDLPEPPQWFSTSPELFDALSIPEGAQESVGKPRRVFGGAAAAVRGRGPRTPRGPRSGSARAPRGEHGDRGERGGRGRRR